MWISVVIASLLVATSLAATQCPSGYVFYQGSNSCLKTFSTQKSFDAARQVCKGEHGDLVKIDSSEKSDFVKEMGQPIAYWIGLSDPNRNWRWQYVDGSPMGSFRKWNTATREPNGRGVENCVMVHASNSRYTGYWNDARCSANLNFVCEVKPTRCPSGYVPYKGGDSCLKTFSTQKSFDAARQVCQGEHGDLVKIDSSEKSDFVKEMGHPMAYWIGLSDPNRNWRWQYVDGSPMGSFRKWNTATREPNGRGVENCVMVHADNSRYTGYWNDGRCSDNLNFVCEVKPTQCPNGYVLYQGSNSCLKTFSTQKSFDAARQVCQGEHGDLVKIDSSEKSDFVKEMGHQMAYWIGLSDPQRKWRWQYVDGSPLGSFRKWNRATREPNGRGVENCVMVHAGNSRYTGYWNDARCSANLNFVCEVKLGA